MAFGAKTNERPGTRAQARHVRVSAYKARQADVQAAEGTPYDPDARATMIVSNLLELDREVRVAGAVFNAANYGASNKTTLSGTGQWSDPASKPIIAILNAMDSMVMRPTKMVVGQLVATQLQTNPNVVAAILGNAGTVGVVPLSAVAQVLGLREIIVGPSFVNTAKPGQTATLSRVWGKFAALICQDPLATPDMGTTFGYTAQWGTRIAGTIADSDMGMRGGHRVRAGESVNEIITAPDLGYLFSAAVA